MTRATSHLVVSLTLIACFTGGFAFGQESDPLREEIRRAWEKREASITSAVVTWTEKRRIRKGWLSDSIRQGFDGEERLKSMKIPVDATVPPQDTSYPVAVELRLSEGRLFVRREDHNWSGEEGRYISTPQQTSYDGSEGRTLREKGAAWSPIPLGIIRSDKAAEESRALYNSPIIHLLRPCMKGFRGWSLDDMEIGARHVWIKKIPCVELVRRQGKHVVQIFIASSLDYQFVRRVETIDGRPLLTLDVKYKPDPVVGHAPDEWASTLVNKNGLADDSFVSSGVRYEINAKVPEDRLRVEFPPGTTVTDLRGGKTKRYVITKSGTPSRVVKGEEEQLPRDKIIAAIEAEEAAQGWRWYALWIAAALGLGCVGLFLWRRGARFHRARAGLK